MKVDKALFSYGPLNAGYLISTPPGLWRFLETITDVGSGAAKFDVTV